jgi:hypothetical protein
MEIFGLQILDITYLMIESNRFEVEKKKRKSEISTRCLVDCDSGFLAFAMVWFLLFLHCQVMIARVLI